MLQNAVDEILQENRNKKINSEVDMNDSHEDENIEGVEIDSEMYQLEQLNIEEEKDNDDHKECHKHNFERDLNNIYYMNNIHVNDIRNTAEYNLLPCILNHSRLTRNNNYCYSPICMGV